MKGPGQLAAAGDFTVIATEDGVQIFEHSDDGVRRRRRNHPRLEHQPTDALITPDGSAVYVLLDDGVLVLPEKGPKQWLPIPEAQGLVPARPAGVPTIYAWGNTADGGALYRVNTNNTVSRHLLNQPILGVGTGDLLQEIVVALEHDGRVKLQSYIDESHYKANADTPISIALAAFIESPRDDLLNESDKASSKAELLGEACADLDDEALVCCVQHYRGLHLNDQLAALDGYINGEKTEPAAVLLGINPSTIAQSIACDAAGYSEWSRTLPQSASDWANTWQILGLVPQDCCSIRHRLPRQPPTSSVQTAGNRRRIAGKSNQTQTPSIVILPRSPESAVLSRGQAPSQNGPCSGGL